MWSVRIQSAAFGDGLSESIDVSGGLVSSQPGPVGSGSGSAVGATSEVQPSAACAAPPVVTAGIRAATSTAPAQVAVLRNLVAMAFPCLGA